MGCNGWLNVNVDNHITPVSCTCFNSSGVNFQQVITVPSGVLYAGNGKYSGWSFPIITFAPSNNIGSIRLFVILFQFLNPQQVCRVNPHSFTGGFLFPLVMMLET